MRQHHTPGPAEIDRLREINEELLEALKNVMSYFEGEHSYDHPDSVKARAALAKATEEIPDQQERAADCYFRPGP